VLKIGISGMPIDVHEYASFRVSPKRGNAAGVLHGTPDPDFFPSLAGPPRDHAHPFEHLCTMIRTETRHASGEDRPAPGHGLHPLSDRNAGRLT